MSTSALRCAACGSSLQQSKRLRRPPIVCRSRSRADDGAENVLVNWTVGAATEALRLAGVGRKEYEQLEQQKAGEQQRRSTRPVQAGDIQGLLRAVEAEFERQYFVTGEVTEELFELDCYFADPTIGFRGLERYKRNLQLVVPFLEQPIITLFSTRQLPPAESPPGAVQLRAEWRLDTGVRLPWRPYVRLRGNTTYTLNSECSRVCSHVEAWSITPLQALLLLLKPGGKPPAPQ